MESVTPYSYRRISVNSKLLFEKFSLSKGTQFIVYFDNDLKIYALIHESGTPAEHFTRDKIKISKSSDNRIDFSIIYTKLLLFPHSTDCYNYTPNEDSVNNYNSREDCTLKHVLL
jgi:hypothetical protein